ncbi:MAG: zinc-dependent alcohol dehydrogenase family protein [Terriglobales bacterium]
MPKIIRFHRIGGPDNLELEEGAVREPGSGEAKLKVQAVGLNRADSLFMRGLYLPPELPSRVGYEAAGVVTAVGPDVDAGWVGKPVATIPGYSMSQYGVLGEEAIVPANSLAEYPAQLSSTQAAAIWMQYLTAYGALVMHGRVRPGDFVLITAASSSVGLAAMAIAKGEGATTIATTRTSKKRAALLALGADHVIAAEEEDLAERVDQITGGKGARLVFDPVAGPMIEKLAAAAAPRGTIFEYGFLSPEPAVLPLLTMLLKGLIIRGYSAYEVSADAEQFRKAKQYIFDRLQDGQLQPAIARTFPLAQAADAYRFLESNEQVGKIVVTV